MGERRKLQEFLNEALRNRRVIAVVGTGVSLAATGNAAHASWPGLLKEGLRRCALLPGNSLDPDLLEGTQKALNKPTPALSTLLSAAGTVETCLGAPNGLEFRDWLDQTIGRLRAQRRDEIEAIAALDVPILTTNYDDLVERTLNRGTTTWMEPANVLRVLSRDSDNILHLHGEWQNKASVVLGPASYQRVADDTASSALKQICGSLTTFLFIGCGSDGLSDPDFAPFFKWLDQAWRGGGRRHFRLCRKCEARPAAAGQAVYDIAYGDDFKKLAPYLTALARDTRPKVPAAVQGDVTRWLTKLLDRTSHIQIAGIGSGVGRTTDASRYPIEQLYTKLRSRAEVLADGVIDGIAARTVADLLAPHPLLLIEGQPGAGKTTFLHLVATMLGRDLLGQPCPDGPSWRQRHLALDDSPPRVPLFLRLSELAVLLEKDKVESADGRGRLLELLDAAGQKGWRTHCEGLLERGEAILLLDGLDEVTEDRTRDRVFTVFRDACRGWPNARIVVTSRPFGAEAVRDMGFHHAVIEPFGNDEIREFIDRWVAALHNLPVGTAPTGAAGDKAGQIVAAALTRPAIRRLAANPVMLTCLCVVHWNEGDLPEGRARLYKAVIRWLIAARWRLRDDAGYSDRFAHEAFAALALAMMGGAKRAKVAIVDLEVAAEAVRPVVERHFGPVGAVKRAREWIRFECLHSGIIEESGQGRIRFWHLTFQEYLAAQALAWLGDGEDDGRDWWPMVKNRLDDLQWRETTELLPGALFDEGGGRRVDTLLERVENRHWAGRRERSLADDANVFGTLGRLLATMSAYGYRPTPAIQMIHDRLRKVVMAIFTPEGAAVAPFKVRLEAAEALGQGGDPRRNVMIAGLGKYPVMVAEFLAFIDAGGYEDARWWAERGWKFRQARGLTEPDEWAEQSQHSNRPVVGVSWYEADAYCRWWSAQTEKDFILPEHKKRRSFIDFEVKVSLAVGIRVQPVGVSIEWSNSCGHCDLIGNGFEWTRDNRHGGFILPRKDGVPSNEYEHFLLSGGNGMPSIGAEAINRSQIIGFRLAAAPADPADGRENPAAPSTKRQKAGMLLT